MMAKKEGKKLWKSSFGKVVAIVIVGLFLGSGLTPFWNADATGNFIEKWPNSETEANIYNEGNQSEINENNIGGSITATLNASSYDIYNINSQYSEIKMEGFGSILIPGNPKLPSKTFLVGLPPGGKVTSVELVNETHEILSGNYSIVPAPPFTYGEEKAEWEENKEIYSSRNPYPYSIYDKIFSYILLPSYWQISIVQEYKVTN